jgi:hypothetical protein
MQLPKAWSSSFLFAGKRVGAFVRRPQWNLLPGLRRMFWSDWVKFQQNTSMLRSGSRLVNLWIGSWKRALPAAVGALAPLAHQTMLTLPHGQ